MRATQDRIVAAIRAFNTTNGDLIQFLTVLRVALACGDKVARDRAYGDAARILSRQADLMLALEAMLAKIGGAR